MAHLPGFIGGRYGKLYFNHAGHRLGECEERKVYHGEFTYIQKGAMGYGRN